MRKVITKTEEIGQLVKEQRKSRQMSQIDFSEEIGITQATLCRLEQGIKSPRIETLIKVLNVIGCRLVIEEEKE